MNPLPFVVLALLLGSTASLWSQFTAAPPKTEEVPAVVPPNVKILRAIPIEEPPVIDVNTLPRTLPEDVKIAYSQCKVESPVIAITFDDGPHPQNTPRLLDMLKERHIKATFFLVGRSVATWPAIVKRIVEEGHEIANHTWTHPQLNHLKQTSVMNELQKTHDAIVKACGVAPLLYRPPYGAILLGQRKAIHDQFRYPTIVWDVDPLDWKTPRSSSKVHDQVLKQTKPGSIILCHDIHTETVNAMPATLDELIARGYQFATVTQLINLESQTAARKSIPVALPVGETGKPAAPATGAEEIKPASPTNTGTELPVR